MNAIRPRPDGAELTIRLVPRARDDRVEGVHGDAIKIRLRAPPVDGKANAALIRFLAKALAVPTSQVVLASGETSRTKRVQVIGLTPAAVEARLLA